ncbi:hypothetical protein [Jiella flava]|uniref:Uncharacterized protein n=1 Tax=Jiella flava TaxID=2816857 RepID=A0A939JT66_9HYPH|nr:hypothetical protein [Jiella flava]
MDSLKRLCPDRYKQFGCAGQAAKIRPLALDQMAARCQSGELDPRIEMTAAAAA